MVKEKKKFDYTAEGADAFNYFDEDVLEDTENLNKDKIDARLTELKCPENPKMRAIFLSKYMGMLGFGNLGGQDDMTHEAEYDSVVKTFISGDWKKMTHKYAMRDLGLKMSDLGYPDFGV